MTQVDRELLDPFKNIIMVSDDFNLTIGLSSAVLDLKSYCHVLLLLPIFVKFDNFCCQLVVNSDVKIPSKLAVLN
jgi:hypothetical protein